MAKKTLYFPHDYGARNDPKLQDVFVEIGVEGVGLYWNIVEQLYEQGGYLPMKMIRNIAYQYRVKEDTIKRLVNNFRLFKSDGNRFWSESVLTRLKERDAISQSRANAVRKRWGEKSEEKSTHEETQQKLNNSEYKCNTNDIQMYNDVNTNVLQKDSNPDTNVLQTEYKCNTIKINKIKENKSKENNIDKSLTSETIEIIDSDPYSFERFWDLYDKKRDVHNARKKYNKLSKEDKEKIFAFVPLYKKANPDKRYRKDPCTFLNQRAWEDEIIDSNNGNNSRRTQQEAIDAGEQAFKEALTDWLTGEGI